MGKSSVDSSKQPFGQRSSKKTYAKPSGSRIERHVMPPAQGTHSRICEDQRRVIAYSLAGAPVSHVSCPMAAKSRPERRLTSSSSTVVLNQLIRSFDSLARGSRREPRSLIGRSRSSVSETAVASSSAAYRKAYSSPGVPSKPPPLRSRRASVGLNSMAPNA